MAQATALETTKPQWLTASAACGACAVGIGVTVLIGWAAGLDRLTRVFDGMVTSKPNTGFALVLAGLALYLNRYGRGLRPVAVALSVATALIGGLTCIEYVIGVDLGIDELFFREPPHAVGSLSPGRMHPTTALAFLLIGLASTLFAADRHHVVAQAMSLAAATLAGVTLVGYVYGVRHFVGLAVYHQMALLTTIGMLALAVGMLLSRPDRGLMVALTSDGPSGEMARWLLPIAIIMPVAIGSMTQLLHDLGIFDEQYSSAVRVMAVVAIFVACVWRNAHSLHASDQERRRAEAERIEGERRFRFLAEAMPQIVWATDQYGQIRYLNKRWFDYTGQSPDDPFDWTAVFDPRDVTSCVERWRRSARTGQTFQGEYRYRRQDGIYRWHLARAEPMRNDAGEIVQWIGTATDIDNQKRAGEERYRSLVEATAAIVWNTPSSGFFETDQPGWSSFTGQTFEEYQGWGWLNAIHPDDRDHTARAWTGAFEAQSIYRVKHRLRRHDGEYRHMTVRAVPIITSDGQLAEWIGIHADVSEQERLLEEMKIAKEAAEAASRAKAEFLANMSHEIRTPMNGVLGMTELALGTDLSDRRREYLLLVKSSADALLNVIDDILDFSKIEAGKLALDPVPFTIRGVVTGTLECLNANARKKGVDLVCQVDPDVPTTVIGDSGRLRQVLVNLVGNAIKFTERGEIVVRVEQDCCDGEARSILFSVADTGIGIPADKRDTIFAPFEQADSSTTRKYGGTGLGLTISSRLVQMMNGRIWVEPNPKGGSIFRFTAQLDPCRDTPPTTSATERKMSGRSLRVLLAEDNTVNQVVVTRILEDQGHRVTIAGDGKLALDAYVNSGPFDLILMDVQMPEMDGFETTAAIRACETLNGCHVPIVALTAHAMAGDRELCLNAGCDDYLTKPISTASLTELVERIGNELRSTSVVQRRMEWPRLQVP